MKVGLHNDAYETVNACVALDKVINPQDTNKFEEAVHFLRETGRYWFKRNGKRQYLTHVEG